MRTANSTGWRGFARDYGAVWSFGAAFGLAGPLGMWRASLDPPWPAEARWVAVLMCAVTAVIAYVLAQNGVSRRDGSKTAQQKRRRKNALLASGTLLLGMFAALAYIYEYESSVLEELQPSAQGNRQIRVVKGAERMPELKADPHSDLEVLQDHLYRPEEVWTSSSLLRLRMYLLGLYLAAFCLLTLGLSFAVLSMTPEQTARNRLRNQPSRPR